VTMMFMSIFFFSSRRRHTRWPRDWSSDVCSSDLDGKTAIRIGGGIAHDFIRQDLHQNTSTVSPFRLTVVNPSVSLDDPWRNYPGGNPFPFNYDKNNPVFTPYGTYLPIPPDMPTSTQYSWNFAIQRQVTSALFVAGTYVGTHITHIQNALELNPAQF